VIRLRRRFLDIDAANSLSEPFAALRQRNFKFKWNSVISPEYTSVMRRSPRNNIAA